MQLGATKIQSSFRGRKGRQKAQEKLAAKHRMAELEKRAVQMFQGNVVSEPVFTIVAVWLGLTRVTLRPYGR